VHCHRQFEQAKEAEPEAVAIALAYIGRLNKHEAYLREKSLSGKEKLAYRTERSLPVVEAFFGWCHEQRQRIDLVKSNPLSKALAYTMKRQQELKVFLSDPEVPMDANHLERALQVIPMGRKTWNFCSTEIGGEHVGIIQSLQMTLQAPRRESLRVTRRCLVAHQYTIGITGRRTDAQGMEKAFFGLSPAFRSGLAPGWQIIKPISSGGKALIRSRR
jgi:hypothetical protein